MPQFRSGKRGSVSVQGAQMALQEFDAEYHGDDLDTTNFEDQGFDNGLIGIVGCNINFKGNWDSAQKPTGNPPGLYPRDDLTNVVATPSTIDNTPWNLPLARVLSSKNNTPVRGTVGFETSLKSSGTFTPP
jgi:hypothetical protein